MTLDEAPNSIRDFWFAFDPQAQREQQFYDACQLGYEPELADAAAYAVLAGSKRTTSSLLWEYEALDRPLPIASSLSVIMDGHLQPVCIVESTQVEILPFEAVDAEFCMAYAESDGSVDSWRENNWPIFSAQCEHWVQLPSMGMPLICEWLQVLHPSDPLTVRRTLRKLAQRASN